MLYSICVEIYENKVSFYTLKSIHVKYRILLTIHLWKKQSLEYKKNVLIYLLVAMIRFIKLNTVCWRVHYIYFLCVFLLIS